MDEAQIKEKLINDLGLNGLSEDKQDQLMVKMTEALLKRIFLETMERLDEQGREEYEKMADGDANPVQVSEFLKSRIEDYEIVVQKIVDDFVEEMKKIEN